MEVKRTKYRVLEGNSEVKRLLWRPRSRLRDTAKVNLKEIVRGRALVSRSQRPRCLRHELSSFARTVGSWVQIPLKAWVSVCIYSVFVLFCVQVVALRRANPPSKEFYRLCIGLRNWKSGQGPTKDYTAIYRYMIRVYLPHHVRCMNYGDIQHFFCSLLHFS
jgi:hypothetical protein